MMRNVSHWTLGGRSADRPATRARVGASYHTIWDSSRTRESPLLVTREKRRDVPVPVRVLVRRTHERRKKKKGGRIVLARAINTRITISTTNASFQDSLFVSSTLFFYPRGHGAYVHTFSIHRPFSLLNIISEQACSIRRLRSTGRLPRDSYSLSVRNI